MLGLKNTRLQAARWVNLGCEFFVLLIFKSLKDLVETFMLRVTLLEDQRGILLHAALFLALFAINLHDLYAKFFCWVNRLTLDFQVHRDCLSGLLCNQLVKLACVVFRRERKVLGEDHMAKDVFSVDPLKSYLVLISQNFENPL